MGSDRLFTAQTRDYVDTQVTTNNDAFYFFESRYYGATIGKFYVPDTVVPDSKDPQALNRYAYALNNPLKLVDPSGHDPMDPQWRANFIAQHGYSPTDRDWQDYQFSLSHPGSGPNGAWTDQDRKAYGGVRSTLGPQLLAEVGRSGDAEGLSGAGPGTLFLETQKAGVRSIAGPDGTRIYLGGWTPGADAWTLGNNIIIGPQAFAENHIDASSIRSFAGLSANPGLRALVAHEYTHVLQYRANGALFLPEYVRSGANSAAHGGTFGGPGNAFEAPAYDIQYLYQFGDPGLPAPWEFSP